MSDLLTMSTRELTRAETMQRLKDRTLTQLEAAARLNLCVRQVKRLWRAYQQGGPKALISRKRGRPGNRRLPPELRARALTLIHSHYADFGPTLAHEKLTEVHGLPLSVETVRQVMIADGLWQPRRRKAKAVHPLRERRACRGELVQIDGSPYDWFEGRAPACTLLVFIDDATGELLELYFTPAETTFSYFAGTRRYLIRHGKPVAFYSDQHGIFRVNQPQAVSGDGLTQFGRAMQELDIQILCASSPQAKGRVERAHQTLQDRLVKELRLRGIAGIEPANAFLPTFLADFNARFALPPRSPHDAHRPLASSDHLDRVFTLQCTRTLSTNLTLQYDRVIYQIQAPGTILALRKAQVLVREDPQGAITIEYKGRPLTYSVYTRQARQAEVVTTKTLDETLKSPLPGKERTPYVPPPDHPWRNYPGRVNPSPEQPVAHQG